MLAVWPYTDSSPVTQEDPGDFGEQVPNMLGSSESKQADAASADSFSAKGSLGFPNGAPASAYHIRAQLADGRPSLIIDPGSLGNLCGDKWAKAVAQAAARSGKNPTYEQRTKPLNVSGVGHGSQSAPFDCTLPIS